jgi:hypothetical protein
MCVRTAWPSSTGRGPGRAVGDGALGLRAPFPVPEYVRRAFGSYRDHEPCTNKLPSPRRGGAGVGLIPVLTCTSRVAQWPLHSTVHE